MQILFNRQIAKLDDDFDSQQKLMWANDSFDGIKVMLAKNIAIAAHELNKMGYTEVVPSEGEDKLFKIPTSIQRKNRR